jgi:hypothetical protein
LKEIPFCKYPVLAPFGSHTELTPEGLKESDNSFFGVGISTGEAAAVRLVTMFSCWSFPTLTAVFCLSITFTVPSLTARLVAPAAPT